MEEFVTQQSYVIAERLWADSTEPGLETKSCCEGFPLKAASFPLYSSPCTRTPAPPGAGVHQSVKLLKFTDDTTKWEMNISSITKKAQQRMYFLRQQVQPANLPMMVHFYTPIIESILTSSTTFWYAAATAMDKGRLQHVIGSAEKDPNPNPLSRTCRPPGP